jgi:branched-chain amino acid transport system ATP-binding protein
MSAEPLLVVERLRKVFGGLTAVDDVSFEMRRGEILGMIGPNGSGKSTVINVISGLYKPTGGEIYFKGQRITHLPPHRITSLGITRTFQLLRLFPGLSVHDNVLAGTHALGRHELLGAIAGRLATGDEERRMRERTQEMLQFFHLTKRADVSAGQVTSGEGRLLEGARALASDPDVILLDEPAAGLNTAETARLEERLETLRDRGKALLLVDHDMRLVMRLASRVVVLDQGKLLAEGAPADVQANRDVVRVYLGTGTVQRRRSERSIEMPTRGEARAQS